MASWSEARLAAKCFWAGVAVAIICLVAALFAPREWSDPLLWVVVVSLIEVFGSGLACVLIPPPGRKFFVLEPNDEESDV